MSEQFNPGDAVTAVIRRNGIKNIAGTVFAATSTHVSIDTAEGPFLANIEDVKRAVEPPLSIDDPRFFEKLDDVKPDDRSLEREAAAHDFLVFANKAQRQEEAIQQVAHLITDSVNSGESKEEFEAKLADMLGVKPPDEDTELIEKGKAIHALKMRRYDNGFYKAMIHNSILNPTEDGYPSDAFYKNLGARPLQTAGQVEVLEQEGSEEERALIEAKNALPPPADPPNKERKRIRRTEEERLLGIPLDQILAYREKGITISPDPNPSVWDERASGEPEPLVISPKGEHWNETVKEASNRALATVYFPPIETPEQVLDRLQWKKRDDESCWDSPINRSCTIVKKYDIGWLAMCLGNEVATEWDAVRPFEEWLAGVDAELDALADAKDWDAESKPFLEDSEEELDPELSEESDWQTLERIGFTRWEDGRFSGYKRGAISVSYDEDGDLFTWINGTRYTWTDPDETLEQWVEFIEKRIELSGNAKTLDGEAGVEPAPTTELSWNSPVLTEFDGKQREVEYSYCGRYCVFKSEPEGVIGSPHSRGYWLNNSNSKWERVAGAWWHGEAKRLCDVHCYGEPAKEEDTLMPQMELDALKPEVYNYDIMGPIPDGYVLARERFNGIRWYVMYFKGRKKLAYLPGTTSVEENTSQPPSYLTKWRFDMVVRYNNVDAMEGFVDDTAAYGTIMHTLIAWYINGSLPSIGSQSWKDQVCMLITLQDGRIPDIYYPLWDRRLRKDLTCWNQFMIERNVKVHMMEFACGSIELGVAGQIDLVCTLDFNRGRVNAIIDMKSGKKSTGQGNSKATQLGIYKLIFDAVFPDWKYGDTDKSAMGITKFFNWHPVDYSEVPNKDTGLVTPTFELVNQTDSVDFVRVGLQMQLFRHCTQGLKPGSNARFSIEGELKPFTDNQTLIKGGKRADTYIEKYNLEVNGDD